ncbi:MAG: carbohydrate kinase [Desulfobacteraceae bacterium]|nr:carbohydrate kinase [Desulfobacteraceae bacterium]
MRVERFGDSYLLGIDVGTTVSKSVVFDLEGHEVAVARCPTALQHPIPSSSEADMQDVWSAVQSTVRELLFERGIRPEAIKAIGVSATVAGVWLLDKNKQPFRNAILWNDGRAASILAAWEAEGIIQEIFNISGNAIFPGMTLPALRWLFENEPDTLATAKYLICAKDWVRYNLTGDISSDESDLSQMPCDIRTRGYSNELFRLCGIQDLFHLFPPVVSSHEVAGGVTAKAEEETGLRQGTPVVTGLTDVQASMIGAGATHVGAACSIVGTSSLNNVVLDQPSFEAPGIGFQFLMPDNLWVRSFTNTSGTMNLDWFMTNFANEERAEAEKLGISVYKVLEEVAASVPLGSGGVIFHPYLNTTGVSAPFRNAAARGQFFGIGVEHERRHLLRAVYEGLALAMRELYQLTSADAPEVIVTGGGAQSSFWCQMFADCTGRRMLIPEGTEFGTKGDAVLAGIGIGIYRDLKDATQRTFRLARIHEPEQKNTEKYAKVYELYRDIYMDMQAHWWHRHQLLKELATLSK